MTNAFVPLELPRARTQAMAGAAQRMLRRVRFGVGVDAASEGANGVLSAGPPGEVGATPCRAAGDVPRAGRRLRSGGSSGSTGT